MYSTFEEAMEATSKAKFSCQPDDLLHCGRSLILENAIKYGVNAMRAHLDVDAVTWFKCIDAGLRLKEELVYQSSRYILNRITPGWSWTLLTHVYVQYLRKIHCLHHRKTPTDQRTSPF